MEDNRGRLKVGRLLRATLAPRLGVTPGPSVSGPNVFVSQPGRPWGP
jgi:hypothetical protein